MKQKIQYGSSLALVLFLFWLPSSAVAGLFGPSSYWECILDDVQGVASDQVVKTIVRQCYRRFPGKRNERRRRAGWFGPKTSEQCFVAYAKETPSRKANEQIRRACLRLYPRR